MTETNFHNITDPDDPRLADAIKKLEWARMHAENTTVLGEAGIKAMERTRSEELRLKRLQKRLRVAG